MGIKKLCTFAKHYKDYPLLWDRVSKDKGVSALTEMPFFFNRNRAAGVLSYLPKTFYEAPKLVKVKAYERIRNGKVENVRSHYRNVEGRLVIRNELHR